MSDNKFCRFAHSGKTSYGLVEGNQVIPLEGEPWSGVRKLSESYPLSEVKLLHPSEPTKIIGLVKAYKQAWEGKRNPGFVRWFIKPASCAASPGEKIELPSAFNQVKVECELSIIIGKKIKNGSTTEADEAIFGYTVGNDIMGFDESFIETTGELPELKDPSLAAGLKVSDKFAPFGPYAVTGYDYRDKNFTLKIENSKTKKVTDYTDSFKNLLYEPAKIVSDLSKILTLNPGDIIMTGTSKSFVAEDENEVTLTIEGLGTLKNYISNKT